MRLILMALQARLDAQELSQSLDSLQVGMHARSVCDYLSS